MKCLGNAMLCKGEWWLWLWTLGHHAIVTDTQGKAGGWEVENRRDVPIIATQITALSTGSLENKREKPSPSPEAQPRNSASPS